MIDSESLKSFPKEHLEVVLDDPAWIPIKRTHKAGFTETGVVSALAAPLKNMSMLYLSSFNTGYDFLRILADYLRWFMVTETSYAEAVQKLRDHMFVVTTDEQEQVLQKEKSVP